MSMKPILDVTALLQETNDRDATRGKATAGSIALTVQDQRGAEVVADIVACMKNGRTVHFYTNGAWSMYELLVGLTEITGPCKVYLSTYALSETSARALHMLQNTGIIKELHCLIDNRIDTRSAGSFQLLQAIADRCVLAACHAKATVIVGKDVSVCIIGSANYTENKRIECGMGTTDRDACDFHMNWIKKQMNDGQ